MSITYDDSTFGEDILDLFNKTDKTPLYQEIGEILLTSIDDNFAAQGRYGAMEGNEYLGGSQKWIPSLRAQGLIGSKWKKNKRNKQGKFGKGKTLQDSGLLLGSFEVQASAEGVIVSSNKEYAPYVHYGTDDGTIPARPFLVIQESDYADIEDAVAQFFERVT